MPYRRLERRRTVFDAPKRSSITDMKERYRFVFFIVGLLPLLSCARCVAQSVASARGGVVQFVRNRADEDRFAKAFATARTNAGGTALERRRPSKFEVQMTCSAAVRQSQSPTPDFHGTDAYGVAIRVIPRETLNSIASESAVPFANKAIDKDLSAYSVVIFQNSKI